MVKEAKIPRRLSTQEVILRNYLNAIMGLNFFFYYGLEIIMHPLDFTE